MVPLLWLGGCVNVYTARGVYHKMQPGETLASLAERHHSTVQELAELNNIDDLAQVQAGRAIYISGVKVRGGFLPFLERESRKKPKKEAHEKPSDETSADEEAVTRSGGIYSDHDRFRWPIEGELSSLYGVRHGRKHDGIDIRAPKGTPVHAAANGEVVFSSKMRGYGNLILVKHDDRFFTVYAHNSANLISKGKKVKKGDIIAKVGKTGKATGPHLHFEVRDGRRARNPLFFLPRNQYAMKAKEGVTGNNESD